MEIGGGLELEVRDLFQAEEGGAVVGSESAANCFVGGEAGFDEVFAVFGAFGGEGDEDGAAGRGFFFGEEPFVDQGFDGAVDYGAIEAEDSCDLILVEGGTAAKGGEDEAARGGAAGFPFELLADGEIGRGDVAEDGVFENLFGNLFGFDENHRTVTVAPSGRRHCGWSLWAVDFLPMAMTMTIS